MKNRAIIFIFISLAVGVIAYIALENLFISIGVFVCYLIFTLFLMIPKLSKYELTKKKYHECYHFINNFIISLSIKKSISGALETTVGSMPLEFKDMYSGIDNLSDNEKLNYLSSYFEFYDYSLFLQVIQIWQEEGGDIFDMSKYLISNVRHNEDYIDQIDMLAKRKYVEIGILWTISLAIVVVLRFALNDFYAKVKGQLIYIVSLIVVLLFVLLTIYFLILKGTSLNLKGHSNHEKVA